MQKIARSPLRISKYLIPMAMITPPMAMMTCPRTIQSGNPCKATPLSRLRRKSVKKTEAVSVKKISLSDDQREEFGNF
jgi:hypothetical protein